MYRIGYHHERITPIRGNIMALPIQPPSGFVPPAAAAFADVDNTAITVSLAAPLPVQIGAAGVMLAGGTNLIGKMTPAFTASGLTPVTGVIGAGAQSGIFTPLNGRDFNLTIVPTGSSNNIAQVERRFPGDSSWYALITDTMRSNLAPSFSWQEAETGVSYRVNVTSGQFLVRLSQ
jgi:hypothetical protein